MSEAVVRAIRFVVATATGVLLVMGFAGAGVAAAAGPAKAGSTFITSYLKLPKGAIAGGESGYGSDSVDRSVLSRNGRFVAFVSASNTLSRAANPDVVNIFRKDQNSGGVTLVSRATGVNGAAPALNSTQPKISANGNLVAFITTAALSPTDVDEEEDVYIRNLSSKETTLATPDTAEPIFEFDLSADGKYIAFACEGVLTLPDANNKADVFRRSLVSGLVDLVSRIPAAYDAGNGVSVEPSISGDGRWIAFASNATNITTGFVDQNGSEMDVFVRDMDIIHPETFLVSSNAGLIPNGGIGESREPAIAGTPSDSSEVRVAYSSYATDVASGGVDASTDSSVYLRTSLAVAPSTLISQSSGGENADSRAHTPAISDDANLVFFSSDASNLGGGDDYYGAYLRYVSEGTTELGSADNDYGIIGDVSGDGNMIVWGEGGGATKDSDPDAFGVFARAIPGGPITFVSHPKGKKPYLLTGAYVGGSQSGGKAISANGRYIAITLHSHQLGAGDSNQIFRRDLKTGKLVLVSRRSGAKGTKSDGAVDATISSDGSRVAFISYEPLVAADSDDQLDAYVRDLKTNTTTLVSRADGQNGAVADSHVTDLSISGNGKRVAFTTSSTNLGVPGGTNQVYVRDIVANKTFVASRANGSGGDTGDGDSAHPQISNDGTMVVFRSRATNIDPDDGTDDYDVYVRNLATNTLLLASRLPGVNGAKGDAGYDPPAISGSGKVIAFTTDDEAFVPGTGPWPASEYQTITRVLSTGENSLASRSKGGNVANSRAESSSLNRDGSLVAFESDAGNLLDGRGGDVRPAVFVKNMTTGKLVGPPAFGLVDNDPQQGARSPSLSDNGRCLAFTATGYNPASGDSSDIRSSYVYTVSGTCSNPRGVPKPKLSKVSVRSGKKAIIRFRLNTKATVTATFQRRKGKRYVSAGKLVRKNQKAGKRVLRKGLKAGTYRIKLSATNSAGKSRTVTKKVRISRR